MFRTLLVVIALVSLEGCSPSPSDYTRVCLAGVAYWTGGGQLSVALDREGVPVPCTRERELTESEKVLVDIADYWIRLIDQKKIEENWNEASKYFQNEIDLEKWKVKISGAREPLGGLLRRKAINLTENMGHKVIIFRSIFSKEDEPLIETVALTKEDDEWRVSGYFIKDEY